ncbi:MAG: histidine kinase [Sphingobacteriaceae bacterium]|nr:histidine kinase [Cytophagaceae bacterium]
MDIVGSSFASMGIAVAVLQTIRKFLQTATRLPDWDSTLEKIKTVVLVVFAASALRPLHFLETWGWIAFSLVLLYTTRLLPDYRPARLLRWGLLPLSVVYPLSKLVKFLVPEFHKDNSDFFTSAVVSASIWLFALWRIAASQKKSLEKERLEREQAEQEIRAENAQLEGLVAARTAELTRQKEELELALTDLKTTQTQLIQAERLASLGELTAGIAHEIQNPLNFVNNFSEVSVELLDELEVEILAGHPEEVRAIADDLRQNLQKIAHHGQRAEGIVKGMLQHSRASTGQKEPTDLNALADEYLRLSYHGLRAKDKAFNATMQTSFAPALSPVAAIPQDLGRVLLNLFNNAFYAVSEKKKIHPTGYQPTVSVRTKRLGKEVEIRVKDNGLGIPEHLKQKIFQPFFTTKPSGQGTGLGLSISYDIITKGHGGSFSVESQEGEGTEFVVRLPA